MKAYSLDLRERIVRAVDQGYKRAEIIRLFGISRATVKRYLKQRRETGQLERKPIPGRPPKKSASLRTGLVAQLEAHPDATLEMHCQFWEQASGVQVSTSTMSRIIRQVGWTRKKKTIGATERDATKLVVIDECGAHIGLTPLYAWAPSGKRAYGKAPRNRGKNLTVIAALTWGGMGESMLIEGSANAVVFEQYIEKILAPSGSLGIWTPSAQQKCNTLSREATATSHRLRSTRRDSPSRLFYQEYQFVQAFLGQQHFKRLGGVEIWHYFNHIACRKNRNHLLPIWLFLFMESS